jgi:hypothetical protein
MQAYKAPLNETFNKEKYVVENGENEGMWEEVETTSHSLEYNGSDSENYSASIKQIVKRIDRSGLDIEYLAKVPRCFPVLMPLLSSLSSLFLQMYTEENNNAFLGQNSSKEGSVLHPDFEKYVENYEFFHSAVQMIRLTNNYMESYHYHSEEDQTFFGQVGSYYGVSLMKDMKVAQCGLTHQIPVLWRQFKEFAANNSKTLEDIQSSFQNITVDSFFINLKDQTIGLGEFNFTQEMDIFNYPLFDFYFLMGHANSLWSTAIINYDQLTNFRSFKQYKSPTLNKMKYKDMDEKTSDYKSATSLNLQEFSWAEIPKLGSDVTRKEIKEIVLCTFINSTNAQDCWEMLVTNYFAPIEAGSLNRYLAILFNIHALVYVPQVQAMVMLAFGFASAMLYEVKEPLETHLPCIYDIITSEDLQFDMEGIQSNTSFLQSLVVPLGPHLFTTLPLRMAESAGTIIENENIDKILENFSGIILEKLSTMVEKGTRAEIIVKMGKEVKKWLLTVDILGVLNGAIRLTQTLLKHCWKFSSGSWPELTLVGDTLVEHVQQDRFWNKLGKMMISTVKHRWNLINNLMKYYFIPYTLSMVKSFEWLAEDVEGHFESLMEAFKQLDEAEYFWVYWGWLNQGLSKYFVCSSQLSETLLSRLYNYSLFMVGYFEPSLRLFEKQSLCYLFDIYTKENGNSRRLETILEASKVKEAVVEMYEYLLQIKSAINCNRENAWTSYWQYIFF